MENFIYFAKQILHVIVADNIICNLVVFLPKNLYTIESRRRLERNHEGNEKREKTQ